MIFEDLRSSTRLTWSQHMQQHGRPRWSMPQTSGSGNYPGLKPVRCPDTHLCAWQHLVGHHTVFHSCTAALPLPVAIKQCQLLEHYHSIALPSCIDVLIVVLHAGLHRESRPPNLPHCELQLPGRGEGRVVLQPQITPEPHNPRNKHLGASSTELVMQPAGQAAMLPPVL